MAEGTTTDQGTRPADQQGGNPVVTPNPKDLLNQLEPGVREVAQAVINSAMKGHKVELQQANEALRAELDAMKQQNVEFAEFRQGIEQFMSEDAGSEDTADPLSTFEKEMTPPSWAKTLDQQRVWREVARRDYNLRQVSQLTTAQLTELKKELEAERAQTKKERETNEALELSRRTARLELDLTLLANDPEINAVDHKLFMRYVSPDVVWDNPSGMYKYRKEDGTLVDLKAGIKAAMPDSLKKSAVANGGSGASGSPPPDLKSELSEAKKDMATLLERAQKSNSDRDLQAYNQQKRKVKDLETKLAA